MNIFFVCVMGTLLAFQADASSVKELNMKLLNKHQQMIDEKMRFKNLKTLEQIMKIKPNVTNNADDDDDLPDSLQAGGMYPPFVSTYSATKWIDTARYLNSLQAVPAAEVHFQQDSSQNTWSGQYNDGMLNIMQYHIVNADKPNCIQRVPGIPYVYYDYRHQSRAYVDFQWLVDVNSCFKNGDNVAFAGVVQLADNKLSDPMLFPRVFKISLDTNFDGLLSESASFKFARSTVRYQFLWDFVSSATNRLRLDSCPFTRADTLEETTVSSVALDRTKPDGPPALFVRFEPNRSPLCRLTAPISFTIYGNKDGIAGFPSGCDGVAYVTPIKRESTTTPWVLTCDAQVDRIFVVKQDSRRTLMVHNERGEYSFQHDESACVQNTLNADTPLYEAQQIIVSRDGLQSLDSSGLQKIIFKSDLKPSCTAEWVLKNGDSGASESISISQLFAVAPCLQENNFVSMQYVFKDVCPAKKFFVDAYFRLVPNQKKVTVHFPGTNPDTYLDQKITTEIVQCGNQVVQADAPLFELWELEISRSNADANLAPIAAIELSSPDKFCNFKWQNALTYGYTTYLRADDFRLGGCRGRTDVVMKIHYADETCSDFPSVIGARFTLSPQAPGRVRVQLTSNSYANGFNPMIQYHT